MTSTATATLIYGLEITWSYLDPESANRWVKSMTPFDAQLSTFRIEGESYIVGVYASIIQVSLNKLSSINQPHLLAKAHWRTAMKRFAKRAGMLKAKPTWILAVRMEPYETEPVVDIAAPSRV